MIDLGAYSGQRGALVEFGLKRQAHADDLERIRHENGSDPRERAAEQAPQRSLMGGARDQHRAELLVGKELDSGVGEDAEKRGRVTPKKAAHPRLAVDIAHCGHNAEPGAGVFDELRVGGLEEDFNPVERADDGLGLKVG